MVFESTMNEHRQLDHWQKVIQSSRMTPLCRFQHEGRALPGQFENLCVDKAYLGTKEQ